MFTQALAFGNLSKLDFSPYIHMLLILELWISSANGVNLNEPYENLLKDKGGLKVSEITNFGTLRLGEKKSMEVWIE
ncbi:UNVERIFIED_CONTAM: hypothetical protein K2H54_060044 [Gekko kuhli]